MSPPTEHPPSLRASGPRDARTDACARFASLLLDATQESERSALRSHAHSCTACATLLRHDEALRVVLARASHAPVTADDAGSTALPPALSAALARDSAPIRNRGPSRRALPALSLTVALAVLTLVVYPRRDLRGQLGPLFDAVLVLVGVGIVTGLLMVLVRGRLGLGVAPYVRVTAVSIGVVGFIVLQALATHGVTESLHFRGLWAGVMHIGCFALGTAVAALFCWVGARLAKHTEVRSPETAGLALGLAGGLTGGLVLQLCCAFAEPSHFALSHGAAVLMGPLLGAVWSRHRLAV